MNHYHSIRIGGVLVLAAMLAAARPAAAQPATPAAAHGGGGVARITGWPAFLQAEAPLPARADTLGLIPAVDTLTLRYRYTADPSAPGPRMTFALAWTPGEAALYEAERVAYGMLPFTPQMVRIALEADVFVEGRKVTDVVVAVDSLALGPAPDTLRFEAVGLRYETAFPGVSAGEARRYFETGFRLGNLRIAGVLFVAGADRWPGPSIGRPQPRPRRPVYVPEPRGGIWIGGLFGAEPPLIVDDDEEADGDYAPRGETVGRGATGDGAEGRDAQGGRSDWGNERAGRDDGARGRTDGGDDEDEDDEEDEEEESLVEEALVAASIVGIVAYGGGTVGYSGSTETPLGLTAGRVYPASGVLLQASINQAVFMEESEQPDRLAVRLLGFYDLFGLPIQPALGAGVILTGRSRTDVAPSLSVGLAGNFGRLVVLGGYDLLREEITFGLAINFRFWQERDGEPVVAER